MVAPQLALVPPRVVSPASGEILPLETAVELEVATSKWRVLQILGGQGSGKTTALSHLAAFLPKSLRVTLLDDAGPADAKIAAYQGLVVFSGRKEIVGATVLALAPWTDDDLIAYLLAACPKHCGSVLTRVRKSPDADAVQGNPALWRLILDELAADENVLGVRAAILRILDRVLADPAERRLAGRWSLAILTHDEGAAFRTLSRLAQRPSDFDRLRSLRHPFVQRLLAAEHIIQSLENARKKPALSEVLPEPLIQELAEQAKALEWLRIRLQQVIDGTDAGGQAMAASILHAMGTGWQPPVQRLHFSRGIFREALWPHAILSSFDNWSEFASADLSRANLNGAQLDRANLAGAKLHRAQLGKASLSSVLAEGADFSHANLTAADADRAKLRQANLQGAILDAASLIEIDANAADLRNASFRGAIMIRAVFLQSRIDGADFSRANLKGAILRRLPLRLAVLDGAILTEADLSSCDLEGIRLDIAHFAQAKLNGAWLTGSILPRADFRGADLSNTGLADIHWEDADLRNADLRGCTFHMGSSRSGLVGSPYPGHGSKTGFYTDDFQDQSFRAPEEIRKANLCGADLRGAKLDGVDFYLVDLRGAKFDRAVGRF